MNETAHIDHLLQAFLDGELAPLEQERIEIHLRECTRCRDIFEDMRRLSRSLGELPRQIRPPRDLWPAVEASLASTAAARDGMTSANSHTQFRTASRFKREAAPGLTKRRPASASSNTSRETSRRHTWRTAGLLFAAVAIIGVGAWLLASISTGSWAVERLAGAPRIADAVVHARGSMRVGDWLTTDNVSRALVRIGVIGDVEVEPGSRLQLRQNRLNDHRIALEAGRIQARIWAPPRVFIVETPAATAVDLGCVYTLTVDSSGRSVLNVASGYVELEREGRSTIVPAGAMSIAHRDTGPGTAFASDASLRLREALERFDFRGGHAEDLSIILSEARPEDAVTLWQILERATGESRDRTYDRLVDLVTPPSGVTRSGVLAGEADMMRAWRMHLGLEALTWWGYMWRKLSSWM